MWMLSYCISIAWAGVTAVRHASWRDTTNMRIARRAVNKPSRSFILTGLQEKALSRAFSLLKALVGKALSTRRIPRHCEISAKVVDSSHYKYEASAV